MRRQPSLLIIALVLAITAGFWVDPLEVAEAIAGPPHVTAQPLHR